MRKLYIIIILMGEKLFLRQGKTGIKITTISFFDNQNLTIMFLMTRQFFLCCSLIFFDNISDI